MGLQNQYPLMEGIQGRGLMLGIKLTVPTKTVVGKCFEKGLLVVGVGEQVLRLLPPLNVTMEELDKDVAIFKEIFEEMGEAI